MIEAELLPTGRRMANRAIGGVAGAGKLSAVNIFMTGGAVCLLPGKGNFFIRRRLIGLMTGEAIQRLVFSGQCKSGGSMVEVDLTPGVNIMTGQTIGLLNEGLHRPVMGILMAIVAIFSLDAKAIDRQH